MIQKTIFACLLGLAGQGLPSPLFAQTPAATPVTYEATSENIINPERGWYAQLEYSANPGTYFSMRNQGALLRRYFRLDDFRNQPISQAFLDGMAKDFENVRKAGLKIIPRFAYNFAQGVPDAPLDRILGHIAQVKTLLKANADVIAFMEAGFIGAWGEWHSSTFGLHGNRDAKSKVVSALLETLPPDRMISLRYPWHKRELFGEAPVAAGDAFKGSAKSRTGHSNDCFLAAWDDWGTYKGNVDQEKTYLNQDNRYVVQGGETCHNDMKFTPCANAKKDLERMRWDVLNREFHLDVLKVWKDGGCYEEISLKLGYRYRLIRSVIQDAVRPGGSLKVDLQIVNDGWGKLFNPRPVHIILRHKASGREYSLGLAKDPRAWIGGETASVTVDAGIPKDMAPGAYSVFLHLPDAAPGLAPRPEYAIRIANKGTWEEATGYNSLLKTVNVDAAAAGAAYSGTSLFKSKGNTSTGSQVAGMGVAVAPVEFPVRGGPPGSLSFRLARPGRVRVEAFTPEGRALDVQAEGFFREGVHSLAGLSESHAGMLFIRIRYEGEIAATAFLPPWTASERNTK